MSDWKSREATPRFDALKREIKEWRERAEKAEAERDALQARVNELHGQPVKKDLDK